MRRYAFMLNARNKAKHVRDAVISMFRQDTPIEILLSDSGSTDGTREILDEMASTYSGPHTVRRLNCPPDSPAATCPGMVGLNEHINWCMGQTEADVVLQLSADDYVLQGRVRRVVEAFEEHNPSMVLTGMYYVDEERRYVGETPWPQEDGWCKLDDIHPKYIGGSTSQAWSREFFTRIGGLSGVGSPDVVMPFLACLDKGAYYVHERLHCYRQCIGVDNTGLESVWKAYPEGAPERLQVEELIHFQVSAGLYTTLSKMQTSGLQTEPAVYILAQAILDRSASWVNVRQRMSLERVAPAAFKI